MPKLHFTASRHADLPLHYGSVPPWLAQRMRSLGGAIIEAFVLEFGTGAVVSRLSDPFWFQAFGCVWNGLAFIRNYNVCDGIVEGSDQSTLQEILKTSVEKAKIGDNDKQRAIQGLSQIAQRMEQNFKADEVLFDKVIEKERSTSRQFVVGLSLEKQSLPPTVIS